MTPRKIQNLREKIAKRRAELGIIPIFDDRGHHYKFPDSEEYKSVTYKLRNVKDEGLMNWRRDRALEEIERQFQPYYAEPFEEYRMPKIHFPAMLEAAREAPVKEFEGAGNIGTATHAWREAWFNYWILTGDSDIANVPRFPNVDSYLANKYAVNSWLASTEAIKRAIFDLKAQPLACELPLADRDTKTGGTGDDIWAVPIEERIPYMPDPLDGPLSGGWKIKTKWENWFVDLKTSNIGNKDSYMLQVATYVHMFEKLYKIKIDKVFILHTSKEKFGQYELIPVKDHKRLWQIAKVAFKLSDMLEEVKEIKKLKGAAI